MISVANNARLDANALSAIADSAADESVKEDMKLNRSRRAAAVSGQIDKARVQIDENKKASDERLEANMDKANGSFWGSIIGIVLIVAAVVLACTGVGAIVCGAFLAAGALSGTLGGAVGQKMAKGNEEAADAAKEKADNAELSAKIYEKSAEDMKDMIKQSEQVQQQVWQDARKRRDERQKTSVAV